MTRISCPSATLSPSFTEKRSTAPGTGALTVAPAPLAVGLAVAAGAGTTVNAPVPGAVLRFSVKEDDRVAEGQEILVMEAMKMETPVKAEKAGKILELAVTQGQIIAAGDLLVRIEER